VIFLIIELLDELVFGLQEAAWPLIRDDLRLTYLHIGILLSLPGIIANLIEPFLFILGDIWRRRAIILAGGVFFSLSLLVTAISRNFSVLLVAFILFNPSSGAFVSLSQAALMDLQPARREQNMARWGFAGSLGVFLGPLLLSALIGLGFGWRHAFWSLAACAFVILVAAFRFIPRSQNFHDGSPSLHLFMMSLRSALGALRDVKVLRWLILLEFSDLMLDVLYGFLALYFVDVAGAAPAQAAIAVAVWTGFGLFGDFLLIPLVDRVKGLNYLRVSVILELILFPAFLLAPGLYLKIALLSLLGLFNSGWYAILRAHLFGSMPGRSGQVLALDNVAGMFGRLLPFGIGVAAQAFGLGAAMWLLLLGPIALLLGLPRALPALPAEAEGE